MITAAARHAMPGGRGRARTRPRACRRYAATGEPSGARCYDAPDMRRLGRHLVSLCTALSLALCVAACALWMLSASRSDSFGWAGWRDEAARTWQGWGLMSQADRITAYHFTSDTIRFDDPAQFNRDQPDMRPHAYHHVSEGRTPGVPAFRCETFSVGSDIRFRLASAPHWVPAVAFALAPALYAGRRLRRRLRAARGCCPACGYDLRERGDRCPECGDSVSPADKPVDATMRRHAQNDRRLHPPPPQS